MSDLVFNDDGTITIPLRGRDAVVLSEPSMTELAKLHQIVQAADALLVQPMVVNPDTATPEQVDAARQRLVDRTMQTYSENPPYGNAVLEICKMLGPNNDAPITADQLPGWCANPNTCRRILTHFQTPLAGQGDGQPTP